MLTHWERRLAMPEKCHALHDIRQGNAERSFESFREETRAGQAQGDIAPR
jgi:hypothetical protein